MGSEPRLRVTVVCSPGPRQVEECRLELATGSRVNDALQASGFLIRWPELVSSGAQVGVWGRHVDGNGLLRDGDRVEIYRALSVDPKVARRQRFSKQGARTTGLFARSPVRSRSVK